MTDADYDRMRAAVTIETIARDTAIYGTAFTYDGVPLDPTKVVMHVRNQDGGVTEVEEYDEWRLTGQPDGAFAPYDFTARTREQIDSVCSIWAKIRTGEHPWTGAKLTRRHVKITRTAWSEVE